VKKPQPDVDFRNQFSTVSGSIYHSEKQVTNGKRSAPPVDDSRHRDLKTQSRQGFSGMCEGLASYSVPCQGATELRRRRVDREKNVAGPGSALLC
jgi:hypothetical protein